jgi:hypothetical protein
MEVTQDNRFNIAPETKLWRYMSFSKFTALLHQKELVLSPAYMFNDPYEGAGGIERNLDKFSNALVDYFWDKVTADLKELKVSKEEMPKILKEYIKSASEMGESNRYFTFVNCWHENETESEAMWKLYTASQQEGIAIQTTYGALRKAIDNPEIMIGRVTYTNFETAFLPGDSYFWYKRKSFEHEREVRIMVEANDEQRKEWTEIYKDASFTISIPIALDQLIESVYVSPYASEWIKDTVEEELKLCGIDKPVLYSKMNDEALFFPSRKQLKEILQQIEEDIKNKS